MSRCRRALRRGVDLDRTIAVSCWCEADVVFVDVAQVGEETASCGRRGCGPEVLEVAQKLEGDRRGMATALTRTGTP